MQYVAVLLSLAALATARPQFTPEQQLVIRQHEAIALANIPSPISTVPGFAEHQAQIAAVLRAQGVDPGQSAHDAAIARVKAHQAELAALAVRR